MIDTPLPDAPAAPRGSVPEGGAALPRVLGPAALTGIGIGGIIGTGIFVMTGIAARDKAGPAVIVSFLVAALVCICAALCYAELAARIPAAGSAYAYASAAFGRGAGWLVGWNVILMYAVAAASVAQGWSHYFQAVLRSLGVHVPLLLGRAPFDLDPRSGQAVSSGAWLDVPALAAVLACTALLAVGVRVSVRVNTAIVALKLGVIALVIGRRGRPCASGELAPVRPRMAGAGWRCRAARAAGAECWPGRPSRFMRIWGLRRFRLTRKRRTIPGAVSPAPLSRRF